MGCGRGMRGWGEGGLVAIAILMGDRGRFGFGVWALRWVVERWSRCGHECTFALSNAARRQKYAIISNRSFFEIYP